MRVSLTDVPRCPKLSAKGGQVLHHFGGVLTSLKKYQQQCGVIAAIRLELHAEETSVVAVPVPPEKMPYGPGGPKADLKQCPTSRHIGTKIWKMTYPLEPPKPEKCQKWAQK